MGNDIYEIIQQTHRDSHDMSSKNHIRILSINGGGVRGIVPALVMKEIENISGKPIQHFFDYIVGTSVGGILALALTKPNFNTGGYGYNATMLPSIFSENGQKIFPQHWFNTIKSFVTTKYDGVGLKSFLNSNFNNTKFTDVLLPVSVFSYCENIRGPKFWSSLDKGNNHFLKDAAYATSAAPTYLPPQETTDEDCLRKCENSNNYMNILYNYCYSACTQYDIDGGIYANNPIILANAILADNYPDYYKSSVTVLSLGTGYVKKDTTQTSLITSKFSALFNDESIIEKMMYGSRFAADLAASLKFGSKYIALNPFIEEENQKLDNSNLDNLLELTKTTERFLQDDRIKDIIKNLILCLDSKDNVDEKSCAKAHEILQSAYDINHFYSDKTGFSLKEEMNDHITNHDDQRIHYDSEF